jgi:hypothetical protein
VPECFLIRENKVEALSSKHTASKKERKECSRDSVAFAYID